VSYTGFGVEYTQPTLNVRSATALVTLFICVF
jgi:hypothetical protein